GLSGLARAGGAVWTAAARRYWQGVCGLPADLRCRTRRGRPAVRPPVGDSGVRASFGLHSRDLCPRQFRKIRSRPWRRACGF
ncbi:hypothetical protein MHH60_32830, partial [Paenibacillus sp. FSL H7-0716]|uniref:hypothetical protein n=1 Tax=Paenibacillus sp. FSL H7-0716 TaxID=2921439 RepID=UPI0030F5BA8C